MADAVEETEEEGEGGEDSEWCQEKRLENEERRWAAEGL
jgi:hypothetical protein